MRARLVRRWSVANLAGVLAASLILAAPVAAAEAYGVSQSSPTPATVDYSDLVTFRGAYTCVNGLDPADLCPTATQSHTATFAIRPAGGATFTAVQTVTTSFRFTSSAGGCPSACSVNFSVVWKAGRAPGSTSTPAGVYDVRLATTLTADEVVLDGALAIDHEDTTTTYSGATSGEAGTALALGAAVADEDLGMFAGTSLYLPDVNFGAWSPVSFALYDETNTTLVAGPVSANLSGSGTTLGTPTLTLPAAGTYRLRTTYPGNDFYRASADLDTVSVTGSTVVDTTPPSELSFIGGGLVDGGAYDFWFVPPGPDGCTAVDVGSGLASCVVDGYSDALGTHTVTATATDLAGNAATASLSYTVVAWTLVGFESLDMDARNVVRRGTPVQLRFEVFAGPVELTSTGAIVRLAQTPISCDDGLALGAASDAGSRSPLRHAGGEFAWSWLAPRDPGSCWQVAVQTADGSTLAATFELR